MQAFIPQRVLQGPGPLGCCSHPFARAETDKQDGQAEADESRERKHMETGERADECAPATSQPRDNEHCDDLDTIIHVNVVLRDVDTAANIGHGHSEHCKV